jgi:hypothetical protein
MKQISRNIFYTLGTALLLLSASCKKTEIKDIEKSGDKLIGIWQVNSINTHTTDTLGNLIGDSTVNNQGTVTFTRGDKNAIGNGYFDYADFIGACANSQLVQYFSNVGAGDALAGGWQLIWDADPEDLRVQFWAETGGGSYHQAVNHSFDGGQQFFYVVQPINQNRRIFYTWKMTK